MDKSCKRCGKLFLPVIRQAKYCIDCRYYRQTGQEPPKSELKRKVVTNNYTKASYKYLTRRRYAWLKCSARRRGLDFTITIDWLSKLLLDPCYYCKLTKYRFSVDRLNNKIGYTNDNTVACCRSCNSRKHVKPAWIFLEEV